MRVNYLVGQTERLLITQQGPKREITVAVSFLSRTASHPHAKPNSKRTHSPSQGLANYNLPAKSGPPAGFCRVQELRMVVTFLNGRNKQIFC